MIIWPAYLVIMIIQLFRKRVQSSKALAVATLIGFAHYICYVTFKDESAFLFFSIMWLLSFSWYMVLDFMDLSKSTTASLFFVMFQLVMTINATAGNVDDSFLHSIYEHVILTGNLLMMLAAFGEKDGMVSSAVNDHSNDKSCNKSKGAA